MKVISLSVWVAVTIALFVLYPTSANWLVERIPYIHLLALPGGNPLLPIVTLSLTLGVFFARQELDSNRSLKMVAVMVLSVVFLCWLVVWGFWLFVTLRGGL